jgi:hypothetical protein
MTVSLNGTSGIVFNDASTQNTSAFTGGFAFRNRLINPAMVIDQRNAGASVTVGASSYAADRWEAGENLLTGSLTVQQISDAPTGFNNSLRITVTAAGTAGAAETTYLRQFVEGYNTADLAWGSANAQTVTISFWVKSSLTGTFSGGLFNAGANRSYVFTYAVNSANTWEQKTVTITGDTAGTWDTTNGRGIGVVFDLGSGSNQTGASGSWTASLKWKATGSVSVIGTLSATWQITGVQLEKGSTATSFDYRPYGTELQLAQRYAIQYGSTQLIGNGTVRTSGSSAYMFFPTNVTMRATPTLTQSGNQVAVGDTFNNLSSFSGIVLCQNGFFTSCVPSVATGSTGQSAMHYTGASGYLLASAEL